MCSVVGGNHHSGCEKILDSRYAQRTIRYAVRAAVFYLEARREVVKTINHYIVIEMPAFNDIFMGYVIVAGDESASADAKFWAGPGDKSFFAAGDVFSEQLYGFCLTPSQL